MNSVKTEADKTFYGWWIVAAGFILMFLFAGSGFYSFSIFIQPLEAEFGWSRGAIALTMTIFFILGGLVAPFVGKLIQTYGPKKIMIISAMATGACFMLVCLTRSLLYFYVVYAMLAVVMGGIGVLPMSILIARWFNKRRGTATGLTMVGISAGGLVLTPVLGLITSAFGWRGAYLFLGLLVWAVGIPVIIFLIKENPQVMGLLPYGEGPEKNGLTSVLPGSEPLNALNGDSDWPSTAAFRTKEYFWITVAFFLAPLAQMGILQHQVPMIMEAGISQTAAATALGLTAGIGGIGKLSFGRISEIIPFRYAVMLCFGLQALAVFILIHTHTMTMVWIYVAIFGFAMGGVVVLLPLTVGHFFGVSAFGVILGVLWLSEAMGGALGIYASGLIFDYFGNYKVALYAFMTAYIVAVIAIFVAGQPKPYKRLAKITNQNPAVRNEKTK
jgi:sugar phosphate permease